MRAAVLYGKNDLRLSDVDKPAIGSDEMLLQVKAAFVCGTDVRMWRNGNPNVPAGTPIILGHEMSGTIAEVGKNVKQYRSGMRVAVGPNVGCGVCDMCVSGNTHLCNDYRALGIQLNGAFAEYVKIPADFISQGNVSQLDDTTGFAEAALAEPLSCVYNAFERAQIRPADSVLIIGSGPIGIMHATLAKMAGASPVIMNDLVPERLDACTKLHPSLATVAGDAVTQTVKDLTHGKGVDVCITACPAPSAQVTALQVTAVNGRIIFFGGLPKDKAVVGLDTNLIHYKQLIVTGTARASLRQVRASVNLAAKGLIDVKSLITHRYSIDGIVDAFEKAGKAEGFKHLISFE